MEQKTFGTLLSFLLITLLVLTPNILADTNFPFGSVGYNKKFTMFPGEHRSVKLSFFNYGNEPIRVDVNVAGDFDIGTSVTPDTFVLENTKEVSSPTEHEWVIVEGDYIKAVPVRVKLSIPENLGDISSNTHNIKVVAVARTSNPESGGITAMTSQVREYNYRISIPGNINSTNEKYSSSIQKEEFYREYKGVKREPVDRGEGEINIKDDDDGQNQEGDEGETDMENETPSGYFSLNDDNSGNNIIFLVLGIVIVLSIFILYRRYK